MAPRFLPPKYTKKLPVIKKRIQKCLWEVWSSLGIFFVFFAIFLNYLGAFMYFLRGKR
jgi:hypothetical protein